MIKFLTVVLLIAPVNVPPLISAEVSFPLIERLLIVPPFIATLPSEISTALLELEVVPIVPLFIVRVPLLLMPFWLPSMVPPFIVRVPLFDMPCTPVLLTVPLLIVRVPELSMPAQFVLLAALLSIVPPFIVRVPLFDMATLFVFTMVPLSIVNFPPLLTAMPLPFTLVDNLPVFPSESSFSVSSPPEEIFNITVEEDNV